MNRRRKILARLFVLIVSGIIFVPPALEFYDDRVDKLADPSFNGWLVYPTYTGGITYFYVDVEFPESKIVMIKNSTNRNYTKTAQLTTDNNNWDCSIGGKNWWMVEDIPYGPDVYEFWNLYIEWWVANYTIHVCDWMWETWNGTHWVEEYAWFYDFQGYVLSYDGMANWGRDGFYSLDFNVTLNVRWRGLI